MRLFASFPEIAMVPALGRRIPLRSGPEGAQDHARSSIRSTPQKLAWIAPLRLALPLHPKLLRSPRSTARTARPSDTHVWQLDIPCGSSPLKGPECRALGTPRLAPQLQTTVGRPERNARAMARQASIEERLDAPQSGAMSSGPTGRHRTPSRCPFGNFDCHVASRRATVPEERIAT